MSKGKEESPHQPFQTSTLFEPNTIWLLIGCLLVAIWYKLTPLIVISIFLILLLGITVTWKKKSLDHIKPMVELSKSRLFPGEDFEIRASVKNDKLLPLIWLEWSFPKNEGVRLGDHEGGSNTIRFLWLLWFQQVKWSIGGKAQQRGVYNIGHVTLRSGDGFRFTEKEELFLLDQKVYVYPKLVSVNVPRFSSLIQGGTKARQKAFIEDPLLHVGIREYQDGDEFRKFNWKATSRTGKLQVNVFQPVVMEQLMMYIDVQGFVDFERVLSVIASVAVKYREQGFRVGFASNALNDNGKRMSAIPPSRDLTPILDQLAEMTQQVEIEKMKALDEILYKGSIYNPLFIFCDCVTQDHYRWYQENKHKLSEVRFYYLNETDYAKQLTAIAKPINTSF